MKKSHILAILGLFLLLVGCTPSIQMEVTKATKYSVDIDYTYSNVSKKVVWMDVVVWDIYGGRKDYKFDITPGEGKSSMHFDGLRPNNRVYVAVAMRYQNKPQSDKALAIIEFDTEDYTPQAVDLGLSVLWYSENLGADGDPLKAGNYYAWGEIKEQEKGWYKYNSYSFWPFYHRTPDKPLPRYDLEPCYDAAVATMGNGWRMPTHEEWMELERMCDMEVVRNMEGGAYMIVTGPNGNQIILPCGEYKDEARLNHDYGSHRGFYWSSTLASIENGYRYHYYTYDRAHSFYFTNFDNKNPKDCGRTSTSPRTNGLNIRPVCNK